MRRRIKLKGLLGDCTDSELVKALKTKAMQSYLEMPKDMADEYWAFLNLAAERIAQFEGMPAEIIKDLPKLEGS